MNKPKKWLEKLNNICLHEKIVIFSLALVLTVLSFDCWFKNLPISGYALIFLTLILIGCTTWGTCHGIKWLLHCNKPLKFYMSEKSQNEKLLRIFELITKTEDAIFDKMFQNTGECLSSLSYPTTLNEQVRLFLKDTERDFVKPWYSEISQNPSFLFDTHLLLEETLFKIMEKLKIVNYKNIILNVLMLYLTHLQEYKKSQKKIAKAKNVINCTDNNIDNAQSNNCDEITGLKRKQPDLVDVYRYAHPGSQNDEVVNYYLKKVTKWILQEYAPQEFVISLQCKILTGILARKVLKSCLTTFEDPIWINIKLIYLLDSSQYNELLQNKVYLVKEKVVKEIDGDDKKEFQLKKPIVITKRYMKPNMFRETTNLFQRTEFSNEMKTKSAKNEMNGRRCKSAEKESLNLSLCSNNSMGDGQGSHISSVLGGIIPSTAGPLLPDNVSVCYESLNKMWQSPVVEKKKEIAEPMAIPFGKSIVDGVKIESKHSSRSKRLSRSRSTDSIAASGDINDPLKVKDVSIGEELCENVRFTSNEDVRLSDGNDDDGKSKNRQSAGMKKLVKTRSFDSGSVAIESVSMDSADEADVQATSAVLQENGTDRELGSVSPVYEEPEDFATTIAKLRSLLQQRESSSTLSDKSVQSIDMPYNNSLTETSDPSKEQSLDLESSACDSQVAPEIPTDGRPFINVYIPKSELITDNNGSPYVLYSIQYDGIYKLKDQNGADEPELVLQTTIVKRRFQEFINLQDRLEECSHLKSAMKGIKGPSKWLNLPFTGKTDDSTSTNRKQVLETFLQQLCSKVEICAALELQEFLAYGYSGSKTFVKKGPESSLRRIDKLLTNKVTDVFNTIKTALPSFDFDSTTSNSVGDNAKGSQEQKLLPGFLNFGNKTEEFELNFDFVYKEPTGESLTDDIRRYFNQKTDSVEHALDVLDSNDWLAEKRECRPISSEGKCVWHDYKDLLDEDMDPLDSWLPVYSVILDIVCELLDESDSWVIKEPVIRLIKVLTGHWELKIEERLSKLDWDQIIGNVIRLLRTIIFQSTQSSEAESIELDEDKTRTVLRNVILRMMPNRLAYFLKSDEVSSAVSLFIESLQHFRTNRDVLLRLMDIILVQLLSCRHLTSESN